MNIKSNFTDHIRSTICKCNLLPVTDEHTKIRRLFIDINKESLLFDIIHGISFIDINKGTYLIYYDQENV